LLPKATPTFLPVLHNKIDPFIFFASAPGFVLSIWYTLSAVKLHFAQRAIQQFHSERLKATERSLSQEYVEIDEAENDDGTQGFNDMSFRSTKADYDNCSVSYNDENSKAEEDAQPSFSTSTGNKRRKSLARAVHKSVQIWDGRISTVSSFPNNNIIRSDGLISIPIQSHHECLVLSVAVAWLTLVSSTALLSPILEPSQQENIIGMAANVNLVFYFGAPLSTIRSVLRTKCSSSIHVHTVALNSLNAFFWCVYGTALFDPFVVIPNAIGLLLGYFLGMLLWLYPRTSADHPHHPAALHQGEADVFLEQLDHTLLLDDEVEDVVKSDLELPTSKLK
jgi:hypothetical protein